MALILKDRVKESSTSSGTGNITLGGAFPGYQTFNAAIATGSTVYYTIHNLTAGSDTEWEVGVGTFTSPATLARNTVLSSSNSGSLVPFTAGASGLEVFVTQPAEQALYTNQATGSVEAFGNGANTIAFTNINASNVVMVSGTISTNAANATDITNKTYVDGLFSQGVSYHEAVLVESPSTAGSLNVVYVQPNGAGNGVGATLTNNGANVALVVDGVTVSNTARVLIYSQSNAVQNGVYTVTNPGAPDPGGAKWVLTRATDADTFGLANPNALGAGDAFFVQSGNTGAGETYVCNTQGTITFGSSNITFAQISSAQIYDAGTGLNLANLTFSISNTAVTAAQYGNDGAVGQFTVNAQGQLTNAANVSINASSISAGTLAVARGGTGTGTAGIGAVNNILGSSLAGTTGTNTANLVFSTSPTITTPTIATSITSSGATFTLANTTSTTINFAGAATTLNQAVSTANVTHNYSTGATLSGNTKTINLGTNGVATSTTNINIGSANGTTVTVNGTTNLANVNVSGNVSVGGSVSGNGASLFAINASNISSGTIDNARTTAASANGASTIVSRDASGDFAANTVSASFSGNGVAITAINASNISTGTINNARTTASSANGASTIVLRDTNGSFDANVVNATNLSGGGTSITSMNASNLSAGTVASARVSGSYTGITGVGTVTAGTWNANVIANAYTTANSANGASTIVARDANGGFTANVGTFTTGSFANGSNTAPSIAFTNATGTGLFLPAANTIAFATANTEDMRIHASSGISIGNTTDPGATNLSVTGTIAGNGAPLTGINASNVSTGTIANARTTAATANGASTIVLRGTSGEFSAGIITADGSGLSAINASNVASGTLAVARGGTGANTLTANNVVLGNGTSAVQFVAPGTTGNILTSNGTTWTSAAAGGGFAAGTVMLFAQTAAPTGWTKNASTGDNSALRVTTGTASTGGSVGFTTAFASQTPSGSVSITSVAGSAGATTLTTPQIPSHSHPITSTTSGCGGSISAVNAFAPNTNSTNATGGGASHTHPFSFSSGSGTFTGNAINLAVQYIDVIRASKD